MVLNSCSNTALADTGPNIHALYMHSTDNDTTCILTVPTYSIYHDNDTEK